jgi:hypothetical protein
MASIHRFEDIKDISVDISKYEAHIDIKDIRDSTDRIELSLIDAAYLLEKLQEKIKKI